MLSLSSSPPLEQVAIARLSEETPEISFPAPQAHTLVRTLIWSSFADYVARSALLAAVLIQLVEAWADLPALLERAATAGVLFVSLFVGLALWFGGVASLKAAAALSKQGPPPSVTLRVRSFSCPLTILDPRSIKGLMRSGKAQPGWEIGWDEVLLWRVLRGVHEIRLRSGEKIYLRRRLLAGQEAKWLPIVRERIGPRLQL